MTESAFPEIECAEICLASRNLPADIDFFRDRLGFRLTLIFPADKPSTAVMAGYGICIRLEAAGQEPAGTLRLTHSAQFARIGALPGESPGGTLLQWVPAARRLIIPPVTRAIVSSAAVRNDAWSEGRAGMLYRDLLPNRLGGTFIASHIRIPVGGQVLDYVHYHNVRFQMIYCYHGWVRVVYEDQGQPFVMRPGDCVLQPPGIRHRVLECSAGLEVIEIGCPAEHETWVDDDLDLPTATLSPEREFNGQRFAWHRAADSLWQDSPEAGAVYQDLGMEAATGGLARVRTTRWDSTAAALHSRVPNDRSFFFRFVLEGEANLRVGGGEDGWLRSGACYSLPAGTRYHLTPKTDDFSTLDVELTSLS